MKSKLEVRQFAVERATMILGIGVQVNDIIEKAKEIEAYVIGEADLPETYDEMNTIRGYTDKLFETVTSSK